MEERTKLHMGLDVHKDSISVAAAEPGRDAGRLLHRQDLIEHCLLPLAGDAELQRRRHSDGVFTEVLAKT